eukprot:6300857-Prymnesium_polylepis.1
MSMWLPRRVRDVRGRVRQRAAGVRCDEATSHAMLIVVSHLCSSCARDCCPSRRSASGRHTYASTFQNAETKRGEWILSMGVVILACGVGCVSVRLR